MLIIQITESLDSICESLTFKILSHSLFLKIYELKHNLAFQSKINGTENYNIHFIVNQHHTLNKIVNTTILSVQTYSTKFPKLNWVR